jgi:hypothetical protein
VIRGGICTSGRDADRTGKPLQQAVFLSSANYFELSGVRPVLGRFFRPEEDHTPGGNPVAVLSYRVWQCLFGGSRAVLGRTVRLNQIAYEVIGVAPPDFKGTLTIGPADVIWVR